eukprot:m.41247 g.41247  ORF g.41247 m.41247 type:complete len:98 (+) comp33119_c0_seq2:520-813(+)
MMWMLGFFTNIYSSDSRMGRCNETDAGHRGTGANGLEYSSFEATLAPARVTWVEFKRFLRDIYGPKRPIEYWAKKLMKVRQTAQETSKDYVSRFVAT